MKLNLFWVPIVSLISLRCAAQENLRAQLFTKNQAQPNSTHEIRSLGGLQDGALFDKTNSQDITLATALALALENNPSLAGFSAEIRAKEAAALQAGLLPNPEFGVEVENFGGNKSLQGFDNAETTIAFSQLVELGGKRANRKLVASFATSGSEWDYKVMKLAVLAATGKAFIEVLLAQEQLSLNADLLKIAEQTSSAVNDKVEAGKVSPVEKSRVLIELAGARTEAKRAFHELEAAKRRLVGFWGNKRVDFGQAIGRLDEVSALPDEKVLMTFMENHPEFERLAAEIDRRKAIFDLTRSEAIPDLTLSAGVRKFHENNDQAFVFGVSIKLPIFNRNQGNTSEAKAAIEKAEYEQRATRVAMATSLSEKWQTLTATYIEVSTYRNEILPSAEETYQSTEFGYREGKLDFLQMLDAQRTLFTVKRQYLLALGSFKLAALDMERLIGVPLSKIPNQQKEQ